MLTALGITRWTTKGICRPLPYLLCPEGSGKNRTADRKQRLPEWPSNGESSTTRQIYSTPPACRNHFRRPPRLTVTARVYDYAECINLAILLDGRFPS